MNSEHFISAAQALSDIPVSWFTCKQTTSTTMFIAGLLVINVFVHRISFSCRILPHSHARSLSRSLFSFPCTHSARLIPWSWINDDVTFKMATRAKMLNMCLEKRNILDYFFNVAFVLTCRDLEQDDFHACENKWIDVVCVLSTACCEPQSKNKQTQLVVCLCL